MPKLVSYIHVALSHDSEEGAEIAAKLAKYPEGERSRVVRAAVLAYLRSTGEAGWRKKKSETGSKRPESEEEQRQSQFSARESQRTVSETISDTGEGQEDASDNLNGLAAKAKGLFGLIK